MSDEQEGDVPECHGCRTALADDEGNDGTPYCAACMRACDEHPAWQAVQRVERGEATASPVEGGTAWDCSLRTSNGWLIDIFPDGKPWVDFDYIERMTAPDGTVYAWPETRDPWSASTLPALLCLSWGPENWRAWGYKKRWWI